MLLGYLFSEQKYGFTCFGTIMHGIQHFGMKTMLGIQTVLYLNHIIYSILLHFLDYLSDSFGI